MTKRIPRARREVIPPPISPHHVGSVSDLEAQLGYRWQNRVLLEQALTHSSMGPVNQERLEWIGDSVLDLLVAEDLMVALPNQREGCLSQARTDVVCRQNLALAARSQHLGRHLRVSTNAERDRVRENERTLADTVEAIIGAAHTDGGLEAARTVAHSLGLVVRR